MQTHAERQSAAHTPTQARSGGTAQFADRRPETAAQNRLQAVAQSAPQAAQLRGIQARADAAAASRLDALQSKTVQRQTDDEEKPLQGKFDTVQRQTMDDELPES